MEWFEKPLAMVEALETAEPRNEGRWCESRVPAEPVGCDPAEADCTADEKQ